jgi:ubiquinone/menaquinone biosynthesis C-methylase UbiE/GNAT superfamily N-acetyltransferase
MASVQTGTERDQFSGVRNEYVILRLKLDQFRPSGRQMPSSLHFGPPRLPEQLRGQERDLLKLNFACWDLPFEGRVAGSRQDSGVFILDGQSKLVGGIYLCDKNEFDTSIPWGQLHYFFVHPDYKGQGIHSLLFAEGIRRAGDWGLEGVFINTDRHGLPELYQRWGAQLWKTIPKGHGPEQNINTKSYNWIVHRIHDEQLSEAIWKYASGVLVDIGCGRKPYASMTRGIVEKHVGVDHFDTLHGHDAIDVIADAYNTTLPDEHADTVLCTMVLEHLEDPQRALDEMYRITKPGGYVIITVPLFWHLHEEPRDFYRYTKYGIRHLFTTAGFRVVEVQPLAGFWTTMAQEFSYYLDSFENRWNHHLIRICQQLALRFAWILHSRGRDRNEAFTWCYLAVGARPPA